MLKYKFNIILLLILSWWRPDRLNAQPANDHCANASTINISGGGWNFGTFYSDTVSLNGATLQFGEYIHPLQVANQKSVWFKFSIPTTRTVIITLMQPGVAPFPMPATAAGWTLFRTNTCFPGSAQVVDPPILNIEGYTHKCLRKGDYLLQVTGTLAANSPIFIKLETAPPSADEVLHDHSAQPHNFGVISGGPINYTYEVGCQSITQIETPCPNTNYNKSAWHIFTTDASVDFYRFEIQETPWLGSLHSIPRQWGYRLYKGNCIQDSIPDGIPEGGSNLTEVVSCKTLSQTNAWSYGADFSPCLLEPNTTYSIQLFIPDNYAAQIQVRMYEVGGGPEVSYNPNPVIASHNLGTLNYGTTSIGDYLTCQGRLSLYNTPACPPALPASGFFNIGGNKYELASWKTFTLGTQTDVQFSFTAWYQPSLAVRIYQGNINNVGCSGLTFYNQFVGSATFRCMPPGDYTIQVLGIMDSTNSHQSWASNLGRYHTLHINVLFSFSQAFGLHTSSEIDNVNSGNPLPNGPTIYSTSDTIDCQNTVLPDGDVCGSHNVRAIYRKVVINQNGILSVGGGNWWRFSYRLYKGDASALPIVGGKIQGLVDQVGCQNYPFKVCVTPGIYTLVSFADSGDVGGSDRPWFKFDVIPPTLFNTPATAENMGAVTIPSPLSITGTPTRFTCDDNPLTILGYAPCNGATKQIYREFYVSQPSLLTFNSSHNCHVTCAGGISHRIFSGRISTNSLTGLYKDCFGGGFTECVPPGWYTVVTYGHGKTFTSPEYTSGRGDVIGDQVNISISINPNAQQFRTIATAYNAGTTDWYPNGPHTAAIPKNWMTYSLGTDFFDCAAGPVEVTPCLPSYNRASWRKFTITKTSYVYIYGFPSGTQTRLYDGDLSINPSAPVYHACITDQMRLCSLPPGTYTLVTFANNSHIGVSFTPTLYVDSVGVSKFDHAAQAYDFGNIPNDNVQYFGKISDPLGPFGRQPSEDFFFCTTTALASDPSNNCPIGQNPPPNALPSPTNPRRNLWYTFTVTGPGIVYVSVYNLTNGKGSQSPFTVYYSPNTTIPPNDSLSPPLQYVTTSSSGCGNYQTVSWYLEPCAGIVTRRYYIVVNNNSYNEPNTQIRVGIRFEPAPPAYVLFDHYSEANVINGNPTSEYQPPYTPLTINNDTTLTGYLGNLNCATADPTDQAHCGKTIWYKFTVGKTGRILINYTRPGPNITTYNSNAVKLLREYIPGDSTNSGLGIVPTQTIYVNGNPNFNPSNYYHWGAACVYPGTYYLMFTGCDFPTETVIPRIWFIPIKGDLCSDPQEFNINAAGNYTALSWINCHTIGEAPGEDGTNMGCLQGPIGRKSQWFKISLTDTVKYNLDIEVKDSTSVTADQIQYRIAYGDCNAMTFDNCVAEGVFIILNLKCRLPGDFWIQVVMPEVATGYVRLNVTATPVTDTSCNPIDPNRPRANFSFNGDCFGEPTYFTNLATTGSSITYLWDFGDASQSTAFAPIHVYPDTGQYIVTQIVCNGTLCDTIQQLIYIKPYPKPSFTISPGPYYAGAPITFTNTSTDVIPGAIYFWDFCADGGYCSATPSQFSGPNPPTVTWLTPGIKKICLTINNWGCDSTYCFEINVQLEQIYGGGPYDGHSSATVFANCEQNIYAGGYYDGHGMVAQLLNCAGFIFAGGPYDGHGSVLLSANCEPAIFVGGPYDGHGSVAEYAFCITTTMWSGGPYDGHGSAYVQGCTPPDTNIFAGGPYDGHGSLLYTSNCVTNIYAGGPYDGHGSVSQYSNCITNIYAGGPYDGHSSVTYVGCTIQIFAGGPHDGHGSVASFANCVSNIFAGGPYDGHDMGYWSPYIPNQSLFTVCKGSSATLTTAQPTNWYTVPTGGTPVATATSTYTTPALTETKIYYVQNMCAGGRNPIIAQVMPTLTPDFNNTVVTCVNQSIQFYNQTIVTTNSVPSIGPSGHDIFQLGTTGLPPSPGRISFSSADYLNFSHLYDNVHQGYTAWSGNASGPSTQWVQWHYVTPKSVNRFYYWNYNNTSYAAQSPKMLRLYYSTGGPWVLAKVWFPSYPSTGNFDTGFFPETNGIFANRWKLELDVEADGPNWGEFQVFAGSPGLGGNVTWDFGDASPTSNAQNPTHTYTTSGTYFVTLSVNHNGCVSQVIKQINVSDCILPITQNYLTANYNPQSTFIDLNWVIDGSFRTAYMEKLVGSSWVSIDTFEFNNNLVYFTEDKQPFYNYNNVFRVRYLDENGNVGYSNVAEVYLEQAPDDYVVIYPNPVQNDEFIVRFMSSSETLADIHLYNELGQQVLLLTKEAQKGLNEWVIRADKLSFGIYHLLLQTPQKNFNHKIVVYK